MRYEVVSSVDEQDPLAEEAEGYRPQPVARYGISNLRYGGRGAFAAHGRREHASATRYVSPYRHDPHEKTMKSERATRPKTT